MPVRALVELTLNGQALGPTVLLNEGSAWYAAQEDAIEWRLRTAHTRGLVFGGRDWKLLNDLPEARFAFDEAVQRLRIEVAASAFESTRLDAMVGTTAWTGSALELSTVQGGFLNYALFATQVESAASKSRDLSGYFEGALFAPGSTLTASVAGLNLGSSEPGERSRFVRIETQWRRDDARNATSLVVGDTVSGSGLVSRPVRFAGLQWRTDFSLRPGFVQFERPSLTGVAAAPSVVELFIDGQLRGRGDVAPGPFEIPPIPFVSGRGEATVLVRDVFGRQQAITQPFYATSTLLRTGVTEHSAEVGATRRAFGVESWRYGTKFASGLMRHGWTTESTSEVKLEASRHQAMAGGALTALLPFSVLATFGGALSRGQFGSGESSLLNVDTGISRSFNLNVNLLRTQGDFRQPSIDAANVDPRRQLNATLSAPLGALGSMALTAISTDTEGRPVRIGSASYSVTLAGQIALVLNTSRIAAAHRTSTLLVLLSMPMGERGSISANRSASGALTSSVLTLQSSAPPDGGLGYRFGTNRTDNVGRHDAGVSARFGTLEGSLDVSTDRSTTQIRADMRGALVHLDGAWHPSRTVVDGFALVRAPGLANATVLVNNVGVGRTDEHGDFVTTSIFAHSAARISLDTDELPLDVSLDPNLHTVTTGFRGGALAAFRVIRNDGVLLLVRMPDGTPLPVGATIRAAADASGLADEALVGYEGKALFTKLRLPAQLIAEYESTETQAPVHKRCTFDLDELPAMQRAQAATRGRVAICVPR